MAAICLYHHRNLIITAAINDKEWFGIRLGILVLAMGVLGLGCANGNYSKDNLSTLPITINTLRIAKNKILKAILNRNTWLSNVAAYPEADHRKRSPKAHLKAQLGPEQNLHLPGHKLDQGKPRQVPIQVQISLRHICIG